MREACDAHAPAAPYDKYKAWCDEYFLLKHRNEPRGVGGIFYDYHWTGDPDDDFAFTRDVGEAFLEVYPAIVRRNVATPWSDADRIEQQVAPRALCRVQPALRPRHDLRPEDRRQRRIDPLLDAPERALALSALPFVMAGLVPTHVFMPERALALSALLVVMAGLVPATHVFMPPSVRWP